MNDFFNNQSKTKVEIALEYYGKYCKGIKDTVDFNKNAGWCPESEVIIYEEILPKAEALSMSVAKLSHAEEQAEIDRQLYEKPLDNITVESQDNVFIIKDTITGKIFGSGDGKSIKGSLEAMYQMLKRDTATGQAETQEKKLPMPDSNDEAPF